MFTMSMLILFGLTFVYFLPGTTTITLKLSTGHTLNISHPFFRQTFSPSLSIRHIQSNIFVLVCNQFLILPSSSLSHNTILNIHSIPGPFPFRHHPIIHTINGKPDTNFKQPLFYRRVSDKTVVTQTQNGQILAISHDRLHLVPLYMMKKQHVTFFFSYPLLINSTTTTTTTTTTTITTTNSLSKLQKTKTTTDLIPMPISSFSSFLLTFHNNHHPTIIHQKSFSKCSFYRIVRISFAYDNSFCARYKHKKASANAVILSTLKISSIPFKSLCLILRPVSIHAHCRDPNDPFSSLRHSSSSSKLLLSKLAQKWPKYVNKKRFDIAVFISGFSDGTNVAGAAYAGAACSNHYAFAWVEFANAPVLAHEIGHLLGAKHVNSGLMVPKLPYRPKLKFSTVTVSQIKSFLNRGLAKKAPYVCIPRAKKSGTMKLKKHNSSFRLKN